jgi:holo-[acyl-carrier protein] synthase
VSVVGLGLDVVELAEFAESIAARPRMLARIFTRSELAHCRSLPRSTEHLAARFAAKEAAMKAAGTGWGEGVQWRDVEVVGARGERPSLVLRRALRRRVRELGARDVLVSLTHSGSYAAAVVTLIARGDS